MPSYTLHILPDELMLCQFAPTAPDPAWAQAGGFSAVLRTADELTVICPTQPLPPDTAPLAVVIGWRALQVQGPLALELVGVLHQLLAPLAHAQISIFALSTYNTDYILVRSDTLAAAIAALQAAGHTLISPAAFRPQPNGADPDETGTG